MDYKEKYEQALDNIKKIKAANKDNKELVDFIDYKYPELKESEDEEIRHYLINFVKINDGVNLSPDDAKKLLAWLEKQGELVNSLSKGLDNAHERIDGLIQKNNSLIEQLEKQRKQETTTGMTYREIFPKFSVGDTLYRQGWANHTVKKVYIDNTHTTYICENDEGLESHIEISEQEKWYKIEKKPTWSEEDEKERKRVVNLLEGWLSTFRETYYAEDCKCGISWLKSLKYKLSFHD